MPGPLVNRAITRAADRVSALRRLPVAKLLALAEVALIAHEHLSKLQPHERRRILELARLGRGRPRNLTPQQREELATLVAKVEPRLFAGRAAEKISPVRLPPRVVRGRAGR